MNYETIDDAKLLAEGILSKTLDPNVGCALIGAIADKLGYPDSLEAFAAIAHDQVGHEHGGITAEDCIDDIFSACHQLIAISISK